MARARARRLAVIPVVVAATLAFAAPAPGAPRGPVGGTLELGTHEGREYQVFLPTGLVGAVPLVVALHGCAQTAEDFATGTRLNAAAVERKFIVVYPIQSRRDNPARCWNWFEPQDQAKSGETAQILGIVDEVKRRHRIDSARVIAIGFSAGAFMTINLACASPDTWAGIGAAAGGPYRCGTGAGGALTCMLGQRLDPERSRQSCAAAGGGTPWRMRASLWHGTHDTVVSVAAFEALTKMVAELLGVGAVSTATRDGAASSRYRAGGRDALETWLVPAMPHAWSGGDARGTHTYPAGPDATTHVLDFLLPGTPKP